MSSIEVDFRVVFLWVGSLEAVRPNLFRKKPFSIADSLASIILYSDFIDPNQVPGAPLANGEPTACWLS